MPGTDDNNENDEKDDKDDLDRDRPGLPDPASVVSERDFVSPKGARYRIIRTTETDPYDPPLRDPADAPETDDGA
jgi:hypothetical protein